uniref:Uncharacterized protein n=1 Tax=Arundo donax TaxID=35708 RepID=A0A0A9HMZ4_ARUDO
MSNNNSQSKDGSIVYRLTARLGAQLEQPA